MDVDTIRRCLLHNFQLVSAVLRGVSETLGTEAQKEGDAGIFARELALISLDEAERALDEQGNMIGSNLARSLRCSAQSGAHPIAA